MPKIPIIAICSIAPLVFSGCTNPSVKIRQIAVRQDTVKPNPMRDTTPADLIAPDTSTNPQYLEALRFLATIRKADVEKMEPKDYFKHFPGYDVDSFLSYFSKEKFSISDLEEGDNDNETYSIEELKKELSNRKGHAFDILAQMGYIYSQPYPQYSHTDFKIRTDGKGIDINMAGNYQLSFTRDKDGIYRLSWVESDHISDL